MIPSNVLIDKLETTSTMLRKILTDRHSTSEVQIADINFCCWAIVQLAFELQASVADELRDLE